MKGNKENRLNQMRRLRVGMLYMLLITSILIFRIAPSVCCSIISNHIFSHIMLLIIGFALLLVLIWCIMGIAETPNVSKGIIEKAEQIASSNNYTPIKYHGKRNMLMFLYGDALKKFNCTLAARLDEEGKVYYAVIDEKGHVVSKQCFQRDATFFVSNFEKI